MLNKVYINLDKQDQNYFYKNMMNTKIKEEKTQEDNLKNTAIP